MLDAINESETKTVEWVVGWVQAIANDDDNTPEEIAAQLRGRGKHMVFDKLLTDVVDKWLSEFPTDVVPFPAGGLDDIKFWCLDVVNSEVRLRYRSNDGVVRVVGEAYVHLELQMVPDKAQTFIIGVTEDMVVRRLPWAKFFATTKTECGLEVSNVCRGRGNFSTLGSGEPFQRYVGKLGELRDRAWKAVSPEVRALVDAAKCAGMGTQDKNNKKVKNN